MSDIYEEDVRPPSTSTFEPFGTSTVGGGFGSPAPVFGEGLGTQPFEYDFGEGLGTQPFEYDFGDDFGYEEPKELTPDEARYRYREGQYLQKTEEYVDDLGIDIEEPSPVESDMDLLMRVDVGGRTDDISYLNNIRIESYVNGDPVSEIINIYEWGNHKTKLLFRKMQKLRLKYPYFDYAMDSSSVLLNINPSDDYVVELYEGELIENSNDLYVIFTQFMITQIIPDFSFFGQFAFLELPQTLTMGYKYDSQNYLYVKSKYLINVRNISEYSFQEKFDDGDRELSEGNSSKFHTFMKNVSELLSNLGFTGLENNEIEPISTFLKELIPEYYEGGDIKQFIASVLSYRIDGNKADLATFWGQSEFDNLPMSNENVLNAIRTMFFNFLSKIPQTSRNNITEPFYQNRIRSGFEIFNE